MKTYISVLLLSFSLISKGQGSLQQKKLNKLQPLYNVFYGNPDIVKYYSQFLNKIDTVPIKKDDIEIRLWFGNGANKINITSFIALTRHSKKWNASYYTFTRFLLQRNDSIKVAKKEPVKLNYDSLYNRLVQDNLLTLNSDSANEQILTSDLQKGILWTDAGPTNYTIQIIIGKKRHEVDFKCPNYYYYKGNVKAFEFPLKVISSLLKLIGVNEPC